MLSMVKPRKAGVPLHSTLAKMLVVSKKLEPSMAWQDIRVSVLLRNLSDIGIYICA